MKTVVKDICATNADTKAEVCCFKLIAHQLDSGHSIFDICPVIRLNSEIPNKFFHMRVYSHMKICKSQIAFDEEVQRLIDDFSGDIIVSGYKNTVRVRNDYIELFMNNTINSNLNMFQLVVIQNNLLTEYIAPIYPTQPHISIMKRVVEYNIVDHLYIEQFKMLTGSVKMYDIEDITETSEIFKLIKEKQED